MSYPLWPETEESTRNTNTGAEVTVRTTYGIVKLSATVTESDAKLASKKANAQLKAKVRQRRAYD